MIIENALERYCHGKSADEAIFTITKNIGMFLDAAEIMYHGGKEAEELRDVVRELKVDLELRLED